MLNAGGAVVDFEVMGKKRRKPRSSKSQPSPPRPRSSQKRSRSRSKSWATVIVVGLVVAAVGIYSVFLLQPTPEVPDVDRSALEPQVAEKIQSHREAIFAEPDDDEAWGRLGMVLQAHGLDAEASECYEKAVEIDPGELRWQYLLIHALRSIDNEKALAQSRRALATDSSYAPAHLLRAELLEEVNEVDEALAHYETAYTLNPESAKAAFGAGRLYMAKGELEHALELLQRAVELEEDAGAIHGSLAQVYRRLGDREKAVQHARLAAERQSAIAIADEIHFEMRQESVSSIAQLERARQATDAGDYEQAETIYRRLVKLRPDDADMHARLGDILALQDRREEAEREYQAALAINPAQPLALYGLGNMLSFEEKYDEALERYRAARESRPDHIPTLLNLASVLAFRGDIEEAVGTLQEAVALEPDSFKARLELATLLLREREIDDAVEHLEAALELDADSGRAHFLIAMALAQKGRFERAWHHAQRAEALGERVAPDVRQRLEREAERASR